MMKTMFGFVDCARAGRPKPIPARANELAAVVWINRRREIALCCVMCRPCSKTVGDRQTLAFFPDSQKPIGGAQRDLPARRARCELSAHDRSRLGSRRRAAEQLQNRARTR